MQVFLSSHLAMTAKFDIEDDRPCLAAVIRTIRQHEHWRDRDDQGFRHRRDAHDHAARTTRVTCADTTFQSSPAWTYTST